MRRTSLFILVFFLTSSHVFSVSSVYGNFREIKSQHTPRACVLSTFFFVLFPNLCVTHPRKPLSLYLPLFFQRSFAGDRKMKRNRDEMGCLKRWNAILVKNIKFTCFYMSETRFLFVSGRQIREPMTDACSFE